MFFPQTTQIKLYIFWEDSLNVFKIIKLNNQIYTHSGTKKFTNTGILFTRI